MPNIGVDIELYCDTCGSGICANGTATYTRNQPCFRIDACQKCMSNAENDGYDKGHRDGFRKGHRDGFREGYEAAKQEYCTGER